MKAIIRLIFPILILLVFATACEENEKVNPDVEIEKKFSIETITVDDALLTKLSNHLGTNAEGRISTYYGDLDLSDAVKTYDPKDSVTRYSLGIQYTSNEIEFSNFVLAEKDDNLFGFYVSYLPDFDWLVQFSGDEIPWGEFTGHVIIYNPENDESIDAYLEDGHPSMAKNGRTHACCTIEANTTAAGSIYIGVTCSDGSWSYYFKRVNCGGGGSSGGTGSGSGSGGGGGTGSGSGSGGGSGSEWGIGSGGGGAGSGGGSGGSSGSGAIGNDETYDDPEPDNPIGVNPPEPLDITSAVRRMQVSALLEEDPFALIENCDQIEQWQELAQHTPPQEVIDKIQDLDDNYLSIIRGDWDIQYIEEAKGPVVNMDYFSVDITQLPLNPETGQRFTPEGFFNYVRTNLDTFFENNSTEFEPYNDDEEAIWNSSNYLGAIMRFDINLGGPFTQDGSVICSDQQSLNWTFTTIKSPEDWSHPVSGNREFGLQLDTDGSYNFFTRGVDRVADKEDVLIGSLPAVPTAFEGADELWNAFQDNLESFINDPTNGGQAQKELPKIDRPNWDKVRDVLEGNRPISDLGCN